MSAAPLTVEKLLLVLLSSFPVYFSTVTGRVHGARTDDRLGRNFE